MWNEILSGFESKYGSASMLRVSRMLGETLRDRKRRPPFQAGAQYVLPELSDRPVIGLDDHPEFVQVRDRFRVVHSRIRREILTHLGRTGRPEAHGGYGKLGGDQWRAVFLRRVGRDDSNVAPFFPDTLAYLKTCTTILYPVGGISFSMLEPGGYIAPHCDRTNVFVHLHQSVVTPPGCGLKVGESEILFEESNSYLFDPSFVHEAWNRSADNRIHLILPVWHPGLTPPEREALTDVFRRLRDLKGE